MAVWRALLPMLAVAATAGSAFGAPLAMIDSVDAIPANAIVIDTRAEEACAKASPASTAGPARCLSVASVTGAGQRLASFRDIVWRLGTLGLDGSEPVLVVGDRQGDRDAIAALLHFAGQAEVVVWAKPIDALEGSAIDSGRTADMARPVVYTAAMRDAGLVLRDELAMELSAGGTLVLDGRSEAEYWGERIRTVRGGHIAGAQSLPAVRLRAGDPVTVPAGTVPVVYGHGAIDGLAYWTLVAAAGVEARLYLDGFANWADSTLPIEAAVYPQTSQDAAPSPSPLASGPVGAAALIGALVGALGTAAAFTFGRKRRA